MTFRLRAGFTGLAFRLRAGLTRLAFRLRAGLTGLAFRLRAGLTRLTFRLRAGFTGLTFGLRAGFTGLTFGLRVVGHRELVGGLFSGAFGLPQRGGGGGVDLGGLFGELLGFVGLFGQLFGGRLGGVGHGLFESLLGLGERVAGLLLGVLGGRFVPLGEGFLGGLRGLLGGFDLLAGFRVVHTRRVLSVLGFLGDGGLGLGVGLTGRLLLGGVGHFLGGVGRFGERVAGLLPGFLGAVGLVVERFLGGLGGGLGGFLQRFGHFALRFLGELGGLVGRFLLFGGGVHGVIGLAVLELLRFAIGFGLLPTGIGDFPFELLGLGGHIAALSLLLLDLGLFHLFERFGDFRQRVVLFRLGRFVQSLLDSVAGFGDLFELFAGELRELFGRFSRFAPQFGGGFGELVGGLQRLVGGLLGVRFVFLGRLVRGLAQLFFHLRQRLGEFGEFLGSFGSRVFHAFRRLFGDTLDLGLFLGEHLGVFFRKPLIFGGFRGVLGERSFGRGGSFQRLGGAGQFADFDGQFPSLGVGQLGGDFGGRLFDLGVRLGDRLFSSFFSRLFSSHLRGVLLCRILLRGLGHIGLLERLGGFLGGLPRFVEPRLHDRRQLHWLGGLFQLIRHGLLFGLGGGGTRFGRFVGLLLQRLSLGDFLLGLFQLSDFGGQLVGALAPLFLIDRSLQLLGDFGEAAEHFVLFRHRLGAFLFEDLLGGFQRRGLGLFEQWLGRGELFQFLRDLSQFLLHLLLLLDQFVAFRRLQISLPRLLAELLLLFHHFADHLERRFTIRRDLAAGFLQLLQERLEPTDHRFLVRRGGVELAVLQRGERAFQFVVERGRLEHSQAFGGIHRHIAAPRRQIAERRDQLQVERGDVRLVLKRVDQHVVAAFRPLVRQRFRHRQHLSLVSDQLPHLGADAGDLQTAMQLLPLAHQFHHDVANALASGLEMGEPIFVRAFLGFHQQLDDLFHLLRRQRVDMLLHVADIAEHRLAVEAVFFELPNLQVENAGDQFTGQQPRLFLGRLLLPQLFRLVRGQCGPGDRYYHEGECHDGDCREHDCLEGDCHGSDRLEGAAPTRPRCGDRA